MPHWQGCLEAIQQCTCHTRWGMACFERRLQGLRMPALVMWWDYQAPHVAKGNASGLARGLCSTSFIEREHAHVGLP